MSLEFIISYNLLFIFSKFLVLSSVFYSKEMQNGRRKFTRLFFCYYKIVSLIKIKLNKFLTYYSILEISFFNSAKYDKRVLSLIASRHF